MTSQESENFKSSVARLNGVAWFGLKNATDLWQVVDAGIGQLLKVFVGQAYRDWLDKEENANKWYGNDDSKFTASEQRILITHWAGEAWEKLCSNECEQFFRGCWEKTGCLLTAEGSEDHKIATEGLPSYKVPPPIEYLQPTEEVPTPNQPLGETVKATGTEEKENDPVEIEPDGVETPDDIGDEWEDHKDNRDLDTPYCAKSIITMTTPRSTTSFIPVGTRRPRDVPRTVNLRPCPLGTSRERLFET